MPRPAKNTVILDLHIDQLAPGRMVKTVTYSRKLQNTCYTTKEVATSESEVRGWCNLNFTVQSVNREERVVTLRYDIPNTRGQSCLVKWPVDGLSQSFGIRL